jgi:uncharacterized protein (TIGR03435 family)
MVLAILASVVIAIPIASQTKTDVPKWEVVSIKPCQGNVRSGAPELFPGRMTECNTVYGFIGSAYVFFEKGQSDPLQVRGTSTEGGPSWVRTERFSITAKAEGTPSTAMMRGPMLQAILEDRFNLKIHRETKEVSVYELNVAKGGPKLQPFKEGSCIPRQGELLTSPSAALGEKPCPRFGFGRGGQYKIDAQGISLQEFSRIHLSSSLGRPVIDKTGIKGLFDFHLEWSGATLSADPTAAPDTTRPSIFAVLEQLGLRLESAKGPADFLVIDSIERPSEN